MKDLIGLVIAAIIVYIVILLLGLLAELITQIEILVRKVRGMV